MNTETLQARASRLVQNEVHLCLSSLVSTLAQGAYALPSKRHGLTDGADELGALAEQAFELACPVLDYEEAVREAGWDFDTSSEFWFMPGDKGAGIFGSVSDVCDQFNIEPFDREVFEHWAVSDWLADKLIEKGEKVDKDFADLCVWARTTTGQAISIDYVIEQITTELHA